MTTDNLFILKLIVSFVLAGGWIAGATLLAEKLGSRIGGLITNLPSNILISLVFIALVQDVDFVIAMVPAIPVGMAINTIFLAIFIFTIEYGLILATVLALITWFIAAWLFTIMPFNNILLNSIGYLVLSVIIFVLTEHLKPIHAFARSAKTYSPGQMMLRAVFAGGIVAGIILLSKILNPFLVGIFSTFPAVLLSSMVILVVNQSAGFAQATGKILILSSTNIVVYGIFVYYTYPSLGIILGTIISFLAAFGWVWLLAPVIRKFVK